MNPGRSNCSEFICLEFVDPGQRVPMSNYRQCRAFLTHAFLALDGETPEDNRLRRAIELLLEAVARTERDVPRSNVVPFPAPSNLSNIPRIQQPGS